MLIPWKQIKLHACSRRDIQACRQCTHCLPAVNGTSTAVAAQAPLAAPCSQPSIAAETYRQRERLQPHSIVPVAAGELPTVNKHNTAHSQQRSQSCRSYRWTIMHYRLLESLKEMPELLPQGSRVLVAVSGGQDSMALLRLLIDLQRPIGKQQQVAWPLQLVVGHCNHNMRPDSAANAAFVQSQVKAMGTSPLAKPSTSSCRTAQKTELHSHVDYMSSFALQEQALEHLLQDDIKQQDQKDSQQQVMQGRHQQDIGNIQHKASELGQHPAHHMGLPYHCRTADKVLRSEADARAWRHQMLQEMALEAGCTHVALGHTATDRAETLLLNLVRGAGPSGLGSMGWGRPMGDSGVQLVRPLLRLSREDTEQLCKLTGTEFYIDSTNSDECYSRNRLRLKVFPHLKTVNKQAVSHMCQTSELLAADSSFLDHMAERALQKVTRECCMVPVPRQAAASIAASSSDSSGASVNCGGRDWMHRQSRLPHARITPHALKDQSLPVLRTVDALAGGQKGSEAFKKQEQQKPNMSNAQSDSSQQEMFGLPPLSRPLVAIAGGDAANGGIDAKQQSSTSFKALAVNGLLRLAASLRYRVIHLWLQHQQPNRAVSYYMVQEVQQMLRKDSCESCRSSTLSSGQCVVRSRGLLVVVSNSTADDLMKGHIQLIASTVKQFASPIAKRALRRFQRRLLAGLLSEVTNAVVSYAAADSQEQQQGTETLEELVQITQLLEKMHAKQLHSQQKVMALQQHPVVQQGTGSACAADFDLARQNGSEVGAIMKQRGQQQRQQTAQQRQRIHSIHSTTTDTLSKLIDLSLSGAGPQGPAAAAAAARAAGKATVPQGPAVIEPVLVTAAQSA